MSWQDVRHHYEEQDDPGPEPKWPEVGKEYEITVAVGYDGKAIVVEAPEEFHTIADDAGGPECGSAYFVRDGVGDLDAGLYRIKVVFSFQAGQGEAGSHDPGGDDWWFEVVEGSAHTP